MPETTPKGFHTITPYLTFKNARQAIDLYKTAFGAIEDSVMEGPDGRIAHACLTIGNSKFFLADEHPQMNCAVAAGGSSPVNFYLYVGDADAAYKKARDAGMKDVVPVSDMFWGDRMGAVTDGFGYKWNLATQVKQMSEDEVRKAAKEFFSKAA